MKHYCCVPFCKSTRFPKNHPKHDPTLTFHEFPSREDLRIKWILAIMRKDPVTGGLWTPTDTSKICGRHFPSEAFKIFPKKKQLYPGVVPTIFDDYPPYMQNRLMTKEYQKNSLPDTEEVLKHMSLQSRIIRISVDPSLQESSYANESSSSTEINLENQNSPFNSSIETERSENHYMKYLESTPIDTLASPQTNVIMIKHDMIQKVNNNSPCSSLIEEDEMCLNSNIVMNSSVDENMLIPSTSLNERETMDTSDNDKSNDTVLAAVVLPLDQTVKVHKVKDTDKQRSVKQYIGRCPCDSILKLKLRSSQKDSQRLRSKIERLREDNAELSSALRRANCLLKAYCIEKLQEGIEDEDAEAFLLKNQLIAYAKKKRDW